MGPYIPSHVHNSLRPSYYFLQLVSPSFSLLSLISLSGNADLVCFSVLRVYFTHILLHTSEYQFPILPHYNSITLESFLTGELVISAFVISFVFHAQSHVVPVNNHGVLQEILNIVPSKNDRPWA